MKIEADYNKVQALKDKLLNTQSAKLDAGEILILVQVLTAAEGDIFPSKAEIEWHSRCSEKLETLDPEKDSSRWKLAMDDVTAYENKYC